MLVAQWPLECGAIPVRGILWLGGPSAGRHIPLQCMLTELAALYAR